MKPADVRIRVMTASDLGRVMAIAAGLKEAPHWPPAAYRDVIASDSIPRRISLVAEDPSKVGVIGFTVARLLDAQAELETIVVARGVQRRGVARLLFARLSEIFRREKVTEVTLEVRASNLPALALYRALGFQPSGRRPRYYADPVEDAILMDLPIR